jgi:transcriptional regulator with XRE-family HTH domain
MARRRKATGANDAVLEWIKSIIQKRNWTATDLARRSKLAPSTLLRALNDREYEFAFSLSTLQKIAVGAGEPIPSNLGGLMRGGEAFAAGIPSDQAARAIRMLEVRSVSALPAKAQSAVRTGKPEMVVAPPHLEGDESAFAFRNPDESLGAWFKPRSLMFATKARDPTGGDIVMLIAKDGRTRVRLLLGIDEVGLRLSKTLPAKEDEKMGFDDIGDVAVIVGVVMG